MKHLSKTAALRATSETVSIVRCDRTSYMILGPWSIDRLDGPSTQQTADSWWKARMIATAWRAECAACLMGIDPATASDAISWAAYADGITNARELLDAAIEANKRARA